MSARNDDILHDAHPTPVLCGPLDSLSASELAARVDQLAEALVGTQPRPRMLGLIADNGPDWVVVDLACERIGLPLVPLPAFFTPAQLRNTIDATAMDALLCAAPALAGTLGFTPGGSLPGVRLPWFRRAVEPVVLPAGTSKITFTSGTTGASKGVCLSTAQQRAAARALVDATRGLGIERHLSLLPLPVLLENIAGVYAPLLAGATCCLPPLADVGLNGSTSFDPLACLDAMERWQAASVILLPQMLVALTMALEAGAPRPSHLRFAAVGGARVAATLIQRARAVGLPAYEGYGLSENASVVAMNVPGTDRIGSVGRPLAHIGVGIEPGGEIVVERAGFLGYLGVPAAPDTPLRTGDLGHFDDDGFLHLDGRCKHQLITSFGRNVAPEWPEAELAAGAPIAQAAVFGEARPALCAVLVPRSDLTTDRDLAAAVDAANRRLPDYARVAFWIRADAPFRAADGTATPNGRVRHDAIWQRHGARLEALYEATSGVATDALL
ncbi:MAG: AMP-binding protein [Burkholderiaceae bacterium]